MTILLKPRARPPAAPRSRLPLAHIVRASRVPLPARLFAAGGLVAAATLLNVLMMNALGPSTPFFFYFPAVIAASLWCGFGPGLFAACLCLVAMVYCNVPPCGLFKAPTEPDAARMAAFAVVATAICLLNSRIRRSATALSAAEARFRLLIEGIRDCEIFVLDPNGMILDWNAGAELIQGYTAAETIGRHFSDFYPPGAPKSKPAEDLAQALAGGRFEEEAWRVRKDGRRFWAAVSLNAVRDEGGALLGFSNVTRDLTARKLAEEKLRQSEEALRRHASELEKALAEMEGFSHTVSHDLRSPLRAVQGYAYLVRKKAGAALDAECRALVDRIAASAERMDRLIKDVLAYARTARDELAAGPVDLDRLVPRILDDYALSEKARVSVKSPLGRVMGRESLLAQAIANLLDNAAKFVTPGRGPAVVIWSERRDGLRRLCISDNGIGIPEEHYARIFMPFERLEAAGAFEGTGMGLAIVKKAVERMGGRLGVESEVGRGSVFWIELPESA